METQRELQLHFFFNLGTRLVGVGGTQGRIPSTLPGERDKISILQEVGWASGSVLDGCGKPSPHRNSICGPSLP